MDWQLKNLAVRFRVTRKKRIFPEVEYAQLFEKGDRAEALEKIRQLLDGGSAIREELRTLRMKGGSTRTVTTLSILIRDSDAEPDHILVMFEATPPD